MKSLKTLAFIAFLSFLSSCFSDTSSNPSMEDARKQYDGHWKHLTNCSEATAHVHKSVRKQARGNCEERNNKYTAQLYASWMDAMCLYTQKHPKDIDLSHFLRNAHPKDGCFLPGEVVDLYQDNFAQLLLLLQLSKYLQPHDSILVRKHIRNFPDKAIDSAKDVEDFIQTCSQINVLLKFLPEETERLTTKMRIKSARLCTSFHNQTVSNCKVNELRVPTGASRESVEVLKASVTTHQTCLRCLEQKIAENRESLEKYAPTWIQDLQVMRNTLELALDTSIKETIEQADFAKLRILEKQYGAGNSYGKRIRERIANY